MADINHGETLLQGVLFGSFIGIIGSYIGRILPKNNGVEDEKQRVQSKHDRIMKRFLPFKGKDLDICLDLVVAFEDLKRFHKANSPAFEEAFKKACRICSIEKFLLELKYSEDITNDDIEKRAQLQTKAKIYYEIILTSLNQLHASVYTLDQPAINEQNKMKQYKNLLSQAKSDHNSNNNVDDSSSSTLIGNKTNKKQQRMMSFRDHLPHQIVASLISDIDRLLLERLTNIMTHA